MSTPLFTALWHGGHLRTLDHALAQSLRRLDPDTPDAVLAAAALASLAIAQGHAGLDLTQAHTLLENDTGLPWPDPDTWHALLAQTRWIDTPANTTTLANPHTPLVLEHGLLYLRRYREYERQLALGLQRMAAQRPPTGDLSALAPLLGQLFPSQPDTDASQARAAALALCHTLLLITGGPGTGKTTTTARLLTLLAAQAHQAGLPPLRMALAAPTGRAAERMAESVRHAIQALGQRGIAPELLACLPATGTTLHRLLGPVPDSPRFRHHADHPLPLDVLVVDEASMVDLPLMSKLVDAVANDTRLLLLGDPDQLPSVQAGDVLAAILSALPPGDTLSAADAQTLQPLLAAGPDVPIHAAPAPAHPFAGCHVHLQRNWRQSQALQLAPLADAVRQGHADTALSLLRSGTLSHIQFHENLSDPLQAQPLPLLAHWQALAQAESPTQALARAADLRLLTAVREGPQGARSLNARIERLLLESRGTGLLRTEPGHFHGQLLIVTENSYRHHLFNGDIGICLEDAQGTLVAWFAGDTPEQPRAFHPATLPAHESAFAMTVHKAQGSEFGTVWLLLPTHAHRVLSRELIYTGITRTREHLHLAGSEAVIRQALARHAARGSGLGWRLAQPAAD